MRGNFDIILILSYRRTDLRTQFITETALFKKIDVIGTRSTHYTVQLKLTESESGQLLYYRDRSRLGGGFGVDPDPTGSGYDRKEKIRIRTSKNTRMFNGSIFTLSRNWFIALFLSLLNTDSAEWTRLSNFTRNFFSSSLFWLIFLYAFIYLSSVIDWFIYMALFKLISNIIECLTWFGIIFS